ncbi:hypothetical protein VN12_26445 [Pirellula sp. SH-Sr6A]|nr:hypothetical protein VN12_26445 [Pirellula sp. SH-Sr6A]
MVNLQLNQRLGGMNDVAYVTHYSALLSAIVNATHCPVVVDSSKYPTDLGVLLEQQRKLPPVFVVHLVRDCRAIVSAWKRKKQRLEIYWEHRLMPRYPTVVSAISWRMFNSHIRRLIERYQVPALVVRYEDFATDPSGVLETVLQTAQVEGGIQSSCVNGFRERCHPIGGNPDKLDFDFANIRSDLGWKDRLALSDRILVRLLAGRMQRAYGYN